MRRLALATLLLAAGCAGGLDVGALADPAEAQRRGAVELAVKSTHPGILREIEAGGGPAIAAAMDAAGVPPFDRPARLAQMRGELGLYEAPGALVATLMLYGS
jgi:hypothetical protein